MQIPSWVILPLRLFLGISFLSAGFDKLTDPTYLEPSASSYIGHQIAQFALGTPLEGFLLNVAVPNASLFGVLVMGGELCIGIAVLLGLLTRFSAAMGLLLSLTFFLSATWNVHPFYFGADLPYTFAWLTLLMAGAGPLALDARVKEWLSPPPITYASKGKMVTVDDTGTAMTRRTLLGVGVTGLTAVLLAAIGPSWGILNSEKRSRAMAAITPSASPVQMPAEGPPPSPQATQPDVQAGGPPAQDRPTTLPGEATPTTVSAATPATQATATTATAMAGLTKVAGPNDVPVDQALDFTLPTGDPAVLVRNSSGYSAYVAICTHEGCRVSYSPQSKIIGCPCHGAKFDAANGGQVLRGPARRPLSSVSLTVGSDGSIYLAG
ncbi:MAG: Rieske 2Fe-2S domain-containing protein [Chloroflexota bacterium]|nr:Rieske 2Fe-2S domain-containing protein [Chloroflexota bacterium]